MTPIAHVKTGATCSQLGAGFNAEAFCKPCFGGRWHYMEVSSLVWVTCAILRAMLFENNIQWEIQKNTIGTGTGITWYRRDSSVPMKIWKPRSSVTLKHTWYAYKLKPWYCTNNPKSEWCTTFAVQHTTWTAERYSWTVVAVQKLITPSCRADPILQSYIFWAHFHN